MNTLSVSTQKPCNALSLGLTSVAPTPTKNNLDTVCFGRQQTPIKRLVRELKAIQASPTPVTFKTVDAFAMKLFKACPKKEQLLDFLRALDIPVLDEKDHPQVRPILDAEGFDALLMFSAPSMKAETIHRQILCKQNAPMELLQHETLHALQDFVGLPFWVADLAVTSKANKKALEIRKQCIWFRGTGFFNFLKNLWYGTLFDIKAHWNTVLLKTGIIKPVPGSVGEAIRFVAKREQEVYGFLVTHAQELNISKQRVAFNKMWQKWYKVLEKISYSYDRLQPRS